MTIRQSPLCEIVVRLYNKGEFYTRNQIVENY